MFLDSCGWNPEGDYSPPPTLCSMGKLIRISESECGFSEFGKGTILQPNQTENDLKLLNLPFFFFLEEEDILQLNYNDSEVKNMYLLTGHALYRQNGT